MQGILQGAIKNVPDLLILDKEGGNSLCQRLSAGVPVNSYRFWRCQMFRLIAHPTCLALLRKRTLALLIPGLGVM
ncbi:MAG: hypothetical protein ACYCZL_12955, partial [Polaromonas sp.]